MFQAEIKRRVAESRERVAPVVRARGGAVIDGPGLLKELSRQDGGRSTWFMDDCHYTPEGNDRLGDLFARAFVEAGLIEGAK
jgi:hypothetical protein